MKQIFRGTSWNLPNCKERRVLTIILPLVDTNGSVKKLTLFLPGLAPLQSLRTKFSVAWLKNFRPGTRHHRIWRTSTTFPKTLHSCNVSKSTYKIYTFELNVNSSTTLRLPHRLPSISTKARVKQMKESATMTNHDPRMNRISSFVSYELLPTTASIRRRWYLKYLVWFLQLFVDCLVCSRYFLQLPCVFLECVMLHGACACFGHSALKTLGCVKPWIGSLSRRCFSLSSIYVSLSSIDNLLVKHQLQPWVDYNSSRNTSPWSDAKKFATCFKLYQDPSTTSGKQKTNPPGLQRTSRRQRLH
jgi:hypothetical protein